MSADVAKPIPGDPAPRIAHVDPPLTDAAIPLLVRDAIFAPSLDMNGLDQSELLIDAVAVARVQFTPEFVDQ